MSAIALASSWGSLQRDVSGRLLFPHSAGYDEGRSLFNRRYRDRRPAAVVCAKSVADVRTALAWAAEEGVPVVARSGGHSYAGYSVNDGLVIDISGLATVSVHEAGGRVVAGGGTRLFQLYASMRPFGVTIPAGTHGGVGVGGLVLGGGVGYNSRAWGLTCDHLVQTELLTVDGRLLTCSAAENSEVFWACRGGGGGNFGVNVSFTFGTREAVDMSTCDLTWAWSDAATVIAALQAAVVSGPDGFSGRLGLATHGHDTRQAEANRSVTMTAQLLGPAADLAEILAPVEDLARPIRRSYVDQTFWSATTAMRHSTAAEDFAIRTRLADEALSEAAIATAIEVVQRWPGSGNPDGGGMGIFSWGGQIGAVAPDATAFPHRSTQFMLSMDTSWTSGDSAVTVADNLAWLDDFYEGMGDHVAGGSYVNFIDPVLVGWRQAYFGDNYDRLAAVKRAMDPDAVLSFPQGIA